MNPVNYLELLKAVSPEITVVITALLVLILGLTSGRKATGSAVSTVPPATGSAVPPLPATQVICFLVAALGLVLAIAVVCLLPTPVRIGGSMIVVTPLTLFFKLICLVLALFTVPLAAAQGSLRHRGEYLAMLLLATIGLMLLVGSEDLLMIFIGLELTGLSLYILTGFDKTDIRSAEAGLKYFLFGSTASAFTLFGLSLVYGMSGATALDAIAAKLTGGPIQPLLAVGMVMTLVGLAFKVAAAPFHLWAPDAYQGGPVSSAAFIASGSKVASFFVLGKIVLIGFGPLAGRGDWHGMMAGWTPAVAILAALSILIGNLVALAQSNVRRLLAYSAVAHAGYTLIGLVAGGGEGFRASMFYTTVYAFTLVGAFGVVALVRRQTGGDDLKNFAGLRARSPLAAGAMTIFLLSLAGLPPLPGFFGKFYLFSVALRGGAHTGLLWLVALALFGSLVSLYYYLVVLKAVLIDQESSVPIPRPTSSLDAWPSAVIVVLAALVVFLGLNPAVLVSQIGTSLH